MDLKAFKEFLKTEEGVAAITAAVEKETNGLKAKNKELFDKLEKIKDENKNLTKDVKSTAADKAKAEQDAAAKSGDIDRIVKGLKDTHNTAIDVLRSTNNGLIGQLNKHVLGKGLNDALVKAGVKPELMSGAIALIEKEHKGEIGDNNGTPFAKFDGQAVSEFVTTWSESDTGKNFVSAQANSGGGSQGANEGSQASNVITMKRSEFDKMNPAKHAGFFASGGNVKD